MDTIIARYVQYSCLKINIQWNKNNDLNNFFYGRLCIKILALNIHVKDWVCKIIKQEQKYAIDYNNDFGGKNIYF